MGVSFDGLRESIITLETESPEVVPGTIVKIDSETFKLLMACNGDDIVGVVRSRRGNYASVQIRGHMRLKYLGNVMIAGYVPLVCKGNNFVKAEDGGLIRLVVKIDPVNKIIDVIL